MESKPPKDKGNSKNEELAKALLYLHEQVDSINHPPSQEEIQEFYDAVGKKTDANEVSELYLNEEEQKNRRIAFIHCEEDKCGFALEFKHPNCTYFYCKGHGNGINIDITAVPSEGVVCETHGPMQRWDLVKDDNICPRCEISTLAIVSVGR